MFLALQQHFPGDLGEVTLSPFTFVPLPGKEEGSLFAPMAFCGLLILLITPSCRRDFISPH